MRIINRKDNGVSPVIAVILMVAITIVLAGVVFIWAQSFTDETAQEPTYYNVKCSLTTNEGTPPTQVLRIEVMQGRIKWDEFNVKISDLDLTTSNDEDHAGDQELITVPDSTNPLGGIDLSVGSSYVIKIISIDQNKIVFNDNIICTKAN